VQHTSIPLTRAFGPQGCMAEVKGRVVAAWCLAEQFGEFGGGGSVYINSARPSKKLTKARSRWRRHYCNGTEETSESHAVSDWVFRTGNIAQRAAKPGDFPVSRYVVLFRLSAQL